jgi:ACS family D-galactonate transporter-like MFS transporter
MSSAASLARSRPASRLWNRSLEHYPDDRTRYANLAIVVAATVLLYYQLYLAGGVATSIMRDLDMTFLYYVNVNVIGFVLGAFASIFAGISDRYGRANIAVAGLGLVALLCTFALPNVQSSLGFAIVYVAIGFVEGIVLVATPALVRDFSPQVGRAVAMGFWTLGPALGSLAVAVAVSSASADSSWQHQYLIAGLIGLVVFAVALLFLRELSPKLRDQLMVSMNDRALIEARARGVDVEKTLRNPWSQVLRRDIVLTSVAISAFLIIYYLATGFFPVFFQTIFGYTQSQANSLGNWFWAVDAATLIVVGILSDRLGVRKPFMALGAAVTIVFTTLLAIAAVEPGTSYGTFRLLMIALAIGVPMTFGPWLAAFTETVERRNPALMAHGLAVWGWIIRIFVAATTFIVPYVVTTVTPLVQKGPAVQAIFADPTPVGQTTIGKVATAASAHPAVVAELTAITARSGAVIAALEAHPRIATALQAAQASGAKPTPAQLAAIKAALGTPVFNQLVAPQTQRDLAYMSTTAPKTLGPANFAALSAPTPKLRAALTTLATVGPELQRAAERSPKQWQKYFLDRDRRADHLPAADLPDGGILGSAQGQASRGGARGPRRRRARGAAAAGGVGARAGAGLSAVADGSTGNV